MARVRIPLYILRRQAKRTAKIQKLPNEVFDLILSFLPKKSDKVALLLSCRALAQLLQAQKIDVPFKGDVRSNVVHQVGSGSNTEQWAHCGRCNLLRPTEPSSWAGGQDSPSLPEDYKGENIANEKWFHYTDLCHDWFEYGPMCTSDSKMNKGWNAHAFTCPECWLVDEKRNHTLGIEPLEY